MEEARPSRTAWRVAERRAAHQIVDNPRVLDDPIAIPILGPGAEERLRTESGLRTWLSRSVRASMAARSRYAEDQLARAVERGTRQYVILGAGLDTFGYRNPYADRGLRVFEVDHPATQGWKRKRLAVGRIVIPPSVTFTPVDFERQTLPEGLQQVGFDPSKPAFFSWLGVTMYLARETVFGTLRFVASCAPRGGVAFDYLMPYDTLNWSGRFLLRAMARRVARAGEPFRTFFMPEELRRELTGMGFRAIEDLGGAEINERYFKGRTDGLKAPGKIGRLLSAEV